MGADVLGRLQREIESLYDVALPLRVEDYLIDAATRAALPGAQPHLPEQLFVRSGKGDVVDVALYLQPALLAQLEADDPFVRLHPGNLEATCIVLEGVSHFVFLAWRLGRGLDVTALELELQAEVDKFCLCALLAAQQQGADGAGPEASADAGAAYDARALWRQLFVRYALQPGLSAEEAQRYRTASRAAGRIARSMIHGERRQVAPQALRAQARLWCRRSLADKMRVEVRSA